PRRSGLRLGRPETRPRPVRGGRDKEAARRKRRIAALEQKVASKEKEIEAIETRLWEEGLELGPVESHRLSEEKAELKGELERLVEEWAKLSEEQGEPVGGVQALQAFTPHSSKR